MQTTTTQMEKETEKSAKRIKIMDQMRSPTTPSLSLSLSMLTLFSPAINLRRKKERNKNVENEESAARVLLLCGTAPLRENCNRFNLLHQ